MKIRIPIYAYLAGFNTAYSIWCYINAKYYGGTTALVLAVWMIVLIVISVKDSTQRIIVDLPKNQKEVVVDVPHQL